jgi:hypothetical protein
LARKAKQNEEAADATGANESTEQKLKRYETIFEELTRFTSVIKDQEDPIDEAKREVERIKEELEQAKADLKALEEMRDGAKHNLFRFLSPVGGEFMPLFDRMEPADEVLHGLNSKDWRAEPVAAIGISLLSLKALTDHDIVLVGQLQDAVLADAKDWFSTLSPLNAGQAAAIVDALNNFIFTRTMKK